MSRDMDEQNKTCRERIDAALDAMGAAVEEISFDIDFYLRDRESDLAIHLICDERRYLDEIAAAHGAEITEEPSGSDMWPVKRSAVIDGATFFQLAEEADDENA